MFPLVVELSFSTYLVVCGEIATSLSLNRQALLSLMALDDVRYDVSALTGHF